MLDPKGVITVGGEYAATATRPGFEEDNPQAYQILQRFQWDVEDMEQVLLDMHGGLSKEEAAQNWIDTHPDQVDYWIEGE